DYFLELVDEAGDRLLRGPDQEDWFWRIGQEYANLRGLMSFAEAADEPQVIARVASRLWPFWWTHGNVAEGRRWAEMALPHRARFDDELRANVLHAAGRLMALQGDTGRAREVLQEYLEVCRRIGDQPHIADALSGLGVVASNLQEYAQADRLWAEALRIYESLDDQWGVARASNNLGDLRVYQGEYADAIGHLEKAARLFGELHSALGESIALINLGRASLLLGEAERAETYFRSSLEIKTSLADKEGIAWNLEGLAGVAGASGKSERAARLFGAADSLRRAISIALPAPDLPLYERMVSRARAGADPEVWGIWWDEGARMELDRALAYAQHPDRS
ncbi:MAG: tetratricopeptide repeat protein, partial [Chloroflexi bacterium]|nr:tetratricopeptide repeat protein [Chloroflexota bacterium]